MKILGISGGTKNGNNDAMCREALMGAKDNGADIEFVRLLDLDLKPCTGCIACVNKIMSGKPSDCVIKDDYAWLSDKMLDADGIIMVMPIFEEGTPAVFHIIQDRFAGPAHDRGMNFISKMIAKDNGNAGPDPRISKDKFVSFIGIGGSDWSTRISTDFNLFAMSLMWTPIDDKVFSWSKGIAMEDDKVHECHKVGENIVIACTDPENAKFQGNKGVCPHCHSRNFYLNDAGEAVCEVCGMVGHLTANGNCAMKFKFPEEQLQLAHDTMPGKLKHGKDIEFYEGRLAETKKSQEYKDRMERYKTFIQASKPENKE